MVNQFTVVPNNFLLRENLYFHRSPLFLRRKYIQTRCYAKATWLNQR